MNVISWNSKFAGNSNLNAESIFNAVVPGTNNNNKSPVNVFSQKYYAPNADGSLIKAKRTLGTPFNNNTNSKARQVGFYFNYYLNNNFTNKYNLIL